MREDRMRVGVIVPQGWTGEYDGWDPAKAWSRTEAVAKRAEELGFESLWVFDHFQTVPVPTDEITFEAFSTLAALAPLTSRVSLGQIVTCAAYRNAALLAKMVSTLDVISGGRMELGLGAGWKQDEWLSYGYGFPSARERLAILEDTLEIVTRMMAPGHATYHGSTRSVEDAINIPKPLQKPHVPILVGGNGPNVTWRLAARFADDLNVDGMLPDELRKALPVIRSRCEEIDRDPASLAVSVHVWTHNATQHSKVPIGEQLGEFRDLGVARVIMLLPGIDASDEPLEELAELSRAAGAELAPQAVGAGA
jgi:F420-dependent oxidoreductase-like protein